MRCCPKAVPYPCVRGSMRRFQRVMGALNRQALFAGFPAERCGAAFKKEIGIAVSEVFEIMMIVSFGISWPMNVMKSYKARTTRGKSLSFLIFILVGHPRRLCLRDHVKAVGGYIQMVCDVLLCTELCHGFRVFTPVYPELQAGQSRASKSANWRLKGSTAKHPRCPKGERGCFFIRGRGLRLGLKGCRKG